MEVILFSLKLRLIEHIKLYDFRMFTGDNHLYIENDRK